MTPTKRPLRLLLVRDVRPGHFNQVEGVALAIARLRDVVVERIDLRPRIHAGGLVRDWAFGTRYFDRAWLLNWIFGIRLDPTFSADIVISSSRKSLVAGSLIARLLGARLIVSGFLEGYDPRDYDLMLVQSRRYAGELNCAYSPLPNTIDARRLGPARLLRTEADLVGARVTLFVGGKAGSYRYAPAEWGLLTSLVSASARQYGLRWSVSTSRRTSSVATSVFSELAAKGELAQFVDYQKAGPGSNAPLLDADLIVVTEDSRSMSAEALSTGRPVVLLRPRKAEFSMATEEIATLAAGEGVVVLPIHSVTPEQFVASVLSIRPRERPTIDAVAAAVAPIVNAIDAQRSAAVGA